jgi:hypothetical protein
MEFGDLLYVVIYKKKWNYRRVPYEDGNDPTLCV